MLHPLTQKYRKAWRHPGGRCARTQTANHTQPRRNWLTEQRYVAVNHGFLLQGYPHIRRITAERFTKESDRGDTDYRKGFTLHNEGGTHHLGVATVDGLPGAMTKDRNRRSGRLVIVGNKHSPAKGFDTKGLEIIAGDILGP